MDRLGPRGARGLAVVGGVARALDGDVLPEGPPADHVEQLAAAADGEHREVALERPAEDRRLGGVEVGDRLGATVGAQLLRLLLDDGRAVRLSTDVVLAGIVFAGLRERVEEHLRAHGEATVAQIRDAVGATRRVVVPLLETLDASRVTVRVGDLRRLRSR